MTRCE